MTEPDSSQENLVAGLDLDHLNPPDIVAFFAGIPRRVAAALVPEDPSDDEQPIEEDDEEADPLPIEEMNAIADAMERLIDRTKSVGFSLEPDVAAIAIAASTRQALPAEVVPAMSRIETGATEVARRLRGISSAAWNANEELLAEARAAVAEAVGPLRAVERYERRED